jgi:hypothetical protein
VRLNHASASLDKKKKDIEENKEVYQILMAKGKVAPAFN